jgi:hypothetical protein
MLSVPTGMMESEFLAAVIDLAHAYQFKCAHFRPALTGRGWRTSVSADGKGFPDLVLTGRGRVIFAELKSDHGVLRLDQRGWIKALRESGAEVFVWRPADLPNLPEILARRAGTISLSTSKERTL